MEGLMARVAPLGRQIPDVRRLLGGNHTPRHTGTPNPSLAGGVKSAREMSGTTLRMGGRAENGSRSRTIHRQSARSNPVTPTPPCRTRRPPPRCGSRRSSSIGGSSNSIQKRRTAGIVNLVCPPHRPSCRTRFLVAVPTARQRIGGRSRLRGRWAGGQLVVLRNPELYSRLQEYDIDGGPWGMLNAVLADRGGRLAGVGRALPAQLPAGRPSRGGVNVAPAARSARTNDVDAVKARRILGACREAAHGARRVP